MNIRIDFSFDTDEVLSKLKLNGPAQQFMTNEAAKLMDDYIPMRQGDLKNNKTLTQNSITYESPYARRQYWENKGNGLRGKQWDKRSMADRGQELVEATEKFIKGK